MHLSARLVNLHLLKSRYFVSEALSLEIKRPEREADHTPPSSTEVKNAWSYTSTHPLRLHGVVFNYARDKSTWRSSLLCTGTILP
jgi:hypothetical protein